MEHNHGNQQTQTDLITKIYRKGKHLWVEATICFNLCLTPVLVMLKSFRLRWLILLLPVLILLKHPTISYGAQTQETSLRIFPPWGFQETTSIHLCNCKESGLNIQKPYVLSIPPDEEQMKRQLVIFPKRTASSICMKCVPTETGTVIIPCSTY